MRCACERPAGLLALTTLLLATLIAAACGGSSAAPTAAPTTAVKAATQSVATTGAVLAPTAAGAVTPVGPTVAAAATALAPTGVAVGTAAAAGAAASAGQLADAGKTVFADNCARCHGDQGQGVTGPALIGPSASYGRFSNAEQLLNYISTAMPMDHPGSLTPQQYLQVTAYLLVQNNILQTSASMSNLGSVPLKSP